MWKHFTYVYVSNFHKNGIRLPRAVSVWHTVSNPITNSYQLNLYLYLCLPKAVNAWHPVSNLISQNQLYLYLCICLPRAVKVWHMVSNLITQNYLYIYLYLCLCSTPVFTCQYLTCRLWCYYGISIVSVLPPQLLIAPPSHCYHFHNFQNKMPF